MLHIEMVMGALIAVILIAAVTFVIDTIFTE